MPSRSCSHLSKASMSAARMPLAFAPVFRKPFLHRRHQLIRAITLMVE
jgi:hypothetical protein